MEFQLFSTKILADIGGMNVEVKVLMWMLAQVTMMKTQASGFMECQQDLLGASIQVGRQAVNRALQTLKDKGYVEQLRPRSFVWRLKPELAFRGNLNANWKTPSKKTVGTDVWTPWSEEERSKLRGGETVLDMPGLEEAMHPRAM